jgi:hypothetical protein
MGTDASRRPLRRALRAYLLGLEGWESAPG